MNNFGDIDIWKLPPFQVFVTLVYVTKCFWEKNHEEINHKKLSVISQKYLNVKCKTNENYQLKIHHKIILGLVHKLCHMG